MQIHKLPQKNEEAIIKKFKFSSLCAKVLASKCLDNESIAELIAAPQLIETQAIEGLANIVSRIFEAQAKQQKVMICGDYDADGICATTILVDAMRQLGIECGFYIPNRLKEGYGLQAKTVEQAVEKGYQLILTVDNGVRAFEALAKAKQLHIDVIVSDHHFSDQEVDCYACLHPQTMHPSCYSLCGAGVALEMARALVGTKKNHVILACIASIADVMELKKETRSIVKLGLQYLTEGCYPAIQSLSDEQSNLWDESRIAFQIVPKINTTGRLADLINTNNTVKYLLLEDRKQIKEVSMQINRYNELRKKLSTDLIERARSLYQPQYSFQLLFSEHFHEGILGLIAGKLQGEFNVPFLIATSSEGVYKGSIRSGESLDLTEFFDDIKHELLSYGGHQAAAGISFSIEKKQIIQDYVNTKMQQTKLNKEICYNVIKVSLKDLNYEQVASLRVLAPFGQGFDEPLFLLRDVPYTKFMKMGKGNHYKWVLNEGIEAILFNSKQSIKESKQTIDIIASAQLQTYNNHTKVTLLIKEMI